MKQYIMIVLMLFSMSVNADKIMDIGQLVEFNESTGMFAVSEQCVYNGILDKKIIVSSIYVYNSIANYFPLDGDYIVCRGKKYEIKSTSPHRLILKQYTPL